MNIKDIFIKGNFWDMYMYGSYLYLIDNNRYLVRIKVQDIINETPGTSLDIFQENEYSDIDYNILYKENKITKLWKFENSVIDLKFYYNNLFYIDRKGLHSFKLFGNNLEKKHDKNIPESLMEGYFTNIEIQRKTLFVSSMSKGTFMIELMDDIYSPERITDNYYSNLASSKYGIIMNSYSNDAMINAVKQQKMIDAFEKNIFSSKGYIISANNTFYKFHEGFLKEFHIKNTIKQSSLNVNNNRQLIRMNHIHSSIILEFDNELLIYSNGKITKRIDLDNKFIDWKVYPESIKYRNQLHILENDGLLIKYLNFGNEKQSKSK